MTLNLNFGGHIRGRGFVDCRRSVGGCSAGIRMSLKGVGRPRRHLCVTRDKPLAGRYVSVSLEEPGLQAVAGCPNAANPDSQPSAALTYGGCGELASEDRKWPRR